MNYRHAYHAGNFADCFKHALLVSILDYFGQKSTPYFVLDTHAGAGRYDLNSEAARRTDESTTGIRCLLRSPSLVLKRYLGLVEQLGLYPGSPALIQAVMRKNDRMACCELQPDEAAILRHRFHRNPQVEIHQRSGWEAIGALLPAMEKRGLVFIDPPFEGRDEFITLFNGLRRGHTRFANGVFAAWYPIKQLSLIRNFYANLVSSGIRDIVAVELHLRDPAISNYFDGCGLVMINPPYQFESWARSIAGAVLESLSDNDTGARTAVVRLVDE